MKKIISFSKVKYDKTGTIIQLTSSDGDKGELIIDFESLLPFANKATAESVDFFIISSCVYGIDRFIERRRNSVDGWSREISVKFPVHNIDKWLTIKEDLINLLSFLTGDYWEIDFVKSNFTFPKKDLDPIYSEIFSQVNLFSGGLDSLIGAINFLKSKPKEKVLFISHYDSQMAGLKDQKTLKTNLSEVYPNQFVGIPSIKVSLINTTYVNQVETKESTFRSRSILFLGLAQLVANAKEIKKIVVPENGSVSLNFPLSKSRRSACSTRTTHPTVMDKLQTIFNQLGHDIIVENPFEYLTKGEMVSSCNDQITLLNTISHSNSCGKRGHSRNKRIPTASHCGVCMPCVYRQASLQNVKDHTTYGNNVLKLEGARNQGEMFLKSEQGKDFYACIQFLKNQLSDKDISDELLLNGIQNLQKIDNYVEVVKKTRAELKSWIKKKGSPELKKILDIK